jgi:hypothetical protein
MNIRAEPTKPRLERPVMCVQLIEFHEDALRLPRGFQEGSRDDGQEGQQAQGGDRPCLESHVRSSTAVMANIAYWLPARIGYGGEAFSPCGLDGFWAALAVNWSER